MEEHADDIRRLAEDVEIAAGSIEDDSIINLLLATADQMRITADALEEEA